MDIRQHFDQQKMGRYQWSIVLMTTLMNLLDGFDVLSIAFTASAIQAELQLSAVQLGYLLSASLIGMALGSLFLAPFADKYGRRPLLLFSTFISALGMFGASFSADYLILMICRILTGIGVGGILACANVLTAEYSSAKWRSFAISIYTAGFAIGAALSGVTALLLQAKYGWRAIFLLGAILTSLSFLLSLWKLPESLEFLQYRTDEKAKVRLNFLLKKLSLDVQNLSLTIKPIQQAAPFRQLFNAQYRHKTLLLWFAFFSIMLSFYFINAWTPALLKKEFGDQYAFIIGILITLGGSVGVLSYGLLATKWNETNLLMLFTLLAIFSLTNLILSQDILWITLAAAAINGCISGLYSLNPIIYATTIRSTGAGWAVGIGRFGAISAPILAGYLLNMGWQVEDLYLVIVGILILTALSLVGLKKTKY